ncbi:STAS domain-containing protein [Dactylosporangium sp. NPDC049742]|uniref:STAS domain-containing protein n=1 Tax=Dactylosporangium sp. NPDC049742 TaxID=3154737 RepID=UPI0034473DD6
MDSQRAPTTFISASDHLQVQSLAAPPGEWRHRLLIAGDLDSPTAAALLVAGADTLRLVPRAVVAVDIAEVRLLGSQGIRCLLNFRKYVEHRGGRMIVVGPTTIVRQVLELTGLLDLFEVPAEAEPDGVGPVGAAARG